MLDDVQGKGRRERSKTLEVVAESEERHAGRMEKAIVFDFDLTLADSTKGVIACVNFALDEMDLPRADDERIRIASASSWVEKM